MMITVFPDSANIWRTESSFRMSSKCSPVVGSSGREAGHPVARLGRSLATLDPVVPPPPALPALALDVRHAVSLGLHAPVPLEGLAPAAVVVELMPAGPVPP